MYDLSNINSHYIDKCFQELDKEWLTFSMECSQLLQGLVQKNLLILEIAS